MRLSVRGMTAAIIPLFLLSPFPLSSESRAQVTRSTLTRRFTPADQISGRYQYLPFEVPPGAGTLRVMLNYDRANGENVVDLGLFEPGPLDLGTRSFRGYSGGSKPGILISPSETTPGYRPGPLPAGTWHVLLGLYKVQPAGVDVTVYVEAEDGPSPRPPRMAIRRSPPVKPAPRWYTGALHTHTTHSDGALAPADLLELFGKSKFDFVAITDHNTVTHQHELDASPDAARSTPLWIVGEEVTTPGGHASVWGLPADTWIDFRVSPRDKRIGELVAAARKAGAIFSVNHPASDCVGCGWSHEFVDGIEAIEISNGRHGEMEKALAIWDGLLSAGRRITGVGSSDWHAPPGAVEDAHVRVFAPSLSQAAILDAIRQGRVIVMRRPRDATPEIVVRGGAASATVGESLTAGPGTPLTVQVTAPGMADTRVVVVADGKPAATGTMDLTGDARLELKAPARYLRVELRGADTQPVAIANPVYLVRP